MPARSYLFVPGDREAMLARAAERGADAIIADLEDAVVPDRRPAARAAVAAWLGSGSPGGCQRWVRVSRVTLAADIAVVAAPETAGVMVPKIQSADDLAEANELLSQAESHHGRPDGTFGLLPMIETAAALGDLPAIAGSPRVRRLMIGEMDLGAELGIDFDDWDVWQPIRLQVVVASAAAGLPGPIGPVARDFSDLDRLRTETTALRRVGYRARAAIHPNQVPVINAAFTPSAAEVAAAARLVEQFDAATAAGRGTAVDAEGRMIDEAAVRAARATLDAAEP